MIMKLIDKGCQDNKFIFALWNYVIIYNYHKKMNPSFLPPLLASLIATIRKVNYRKYLIQPKTIMMEE